MALADAQIAKVTSIVNSKLSEVQGWASQARSAAETAIDAVGAIEIPNIEVVFPTAPNIESPTDPSLGAVPDHTVSNSPESVAWTVTGTLPFKAPEAIPAPEYGAPAEVPDRPSAELPIPPTTYPTAVNPAAPTAPALTEPSAPSIELPDSPDLVPITIPTLDMPEITAFEGEVPLFQPYTEAMTRLADKVTDVFDAAKERLTKTTVDYRIAFDNQFKNRYLEPVAPTDKALLKPLYTNNRAHQRKRLMDEVAAEVDREVAAKSEQVVAAWAARNFSTVPGMLVGQINELEIEGGRKIRQQSSKINQEIAKLAMEDFEKMLGVYVSLEQNLIDLHLFELQYELEKQKLLVQGQMELFNATLEMYKAQQGAVNVYIDAFKAEQQAKIQLVGAYKTAVDGAIAETAENEARVQIYTSQVGVLKAQTDVYNTQVRAATAPIEAYKATLIGTKAEADTAVANIEAYREAVRGYAAAVDAASAEIRAYAAQVQASASGAGVAETNARAYATHIQEAARSNNVYKTFALEQAEVLGANLQAFRDAGNTNESFLRAKAAQVSAQTEVTSARVSAFDKYVRAYSSYNRAIAENTAAVQNFSMTSAENAARAQALANQAKAETDRITAGALGGKASALAGLAQGAMSALHVSASASGSGSTSSSATYSKSTTSNWGGNTSQNESKVQRLSA